jgi:hypothetical protein
VWVMVWRCLTSFSSLVAMRRHSFGQPMVRSTILQRIYYNVYITTKIGLAVEGLGAGVFVLVMGDHRSDSATTQLRTNRFRGVIFITRQHPRTALIGAAIRLHGDLLHDRLKGLRLVRLTPCQNHRQQPTLRVAQHVRLGPEPAL